MLMDIWQNINNGWQSLSADAQGIILRVVLAVLALVIVWLLRRVLAWLVLSPIRRASEKNRILAALLQVVEVPARFLVIAAAVFIGASILGLNDTFLQNLVRTLVLIGVALGVYRLVDVLGFSSKQLNDLTGLVLEQELLPFFRTALRLVILAVAFVIIAQEWGYDVSGLVAGLGLGGLAFSLAAQDTIANLFGFTAVVGDRPFVEGEYIRSDVFEGTVEHVGIRSTRVRQLDQSLVIVPNNKMATMPITNWSRLKRRRYHGTLKVSYKANSSDLRHLVTALRALLEARPHVEKGSIQVFLGQLTEVGIEIQISCMIRLVDYMGYATECQEITLEVLTLLEASPVDFVAQQGLG
jgi:MscS family membrane protein